MKPGFYRMSNEEYHSGPGLSKSQLHEILRSPAHMKAPKKETPALPFGSAFHTYTLEKDLFVDTYMIKPQGMSFATKDGKALRSEAEESGKDILSWDDWQTIKGMAQAIWDNPIAAELLSDGEAEISGFWNDPIYPDILCKFRADWINKTTRTLVDLKSTVDAREHYFTGAAYKLGYHMQAGWYLYGATQITGIEHDDFRFIAVEKEPPYGVMVYRASQEMIQEGLIDCQKALEIYANCLKESRWPCYPEVERDLMLPGWVKRSKDMAIYEDANLRETTD